MRASNWLANVFNFLGDSLERFNPAAFRFLSATLPYLTPVPVAWLTSQSAGQFLHFDKTVAFIFVFSLEGIGLWFTSLLVDSVVDWIRSKNWRSFTPVIMFTVAVGCYVYLLVNLNVTLEQATGNANPVLSKVITLMCFLPLITGIGNGYYKLKLDYKTDLELSKRHQEEIDLKKLDKELEFKQSLQEAEIRKLQEQGALELQKLQATNELKLRKFQIQQEISRKFPESSVESLESSKKVSNPSESFQEGSGKLESWRKVKDKLSREDLERLANLSPDGIREYAKGTGFTYKTISNWRTNARNELGLK